MTQNAKTQKTQMCVFVQNYKKTEMEIFAFCVIIHEPIKIQACPVPQNDRLNLLFMEDIHTGFKKGARNGCKIPI